MQARDLNVKFNKLISLDADGTGSEKKSGGCGARKKCRYHTSAARLSLLFEARTACSATCPTLHLKDATPLVLQHRFCSFL